MSARPRCGLCGKAIKATEAFLFEQRAAGSRSHRHARCVRDQLLAERERLAGQIFDIDAQLLET